MYQLDQSLRDILALLTEYKLPDKVTAWQKQAAEGLIDEEARATFVALGWMSSKDRRARKVPPPAKVDARGPLAVKE